VLLSLDGFEFQFGHGYRVKIEAGRVAPTIGRPQGVKYSLTLHDPDGRQVPYRGPAELLEDFYREVERILAERGAL